MSGARTIMSSRRIHVSSQPRPARLGVSETVGVILHPLQHVKEASRSLLISLSNRFVAQVPDLVQVGGLHVILSVPSNHRSLDSCLSVFLGQMGSGLVEQETAAYLNLLVLSQLHLVEEIERELRSLFLVSLLSKTRALKIGYGDHIIMKLPGLFSVRANDDSMKEVADTCIVNLDRQINMTSAPTRN